MGGNGPGTPGVRAGMPPFRIDGTWAGRPDRCSAPAERRLCAPGRAARTTGTTGRWSGAGHARPPAAAATVRGPRPRRGPARRRPWRTRTRHRGAIQRRTRGTARERPARHPRGAVHGTVGWAPAAADRARRTVPPRARHLGARRGSALIACPLAHGRAASVGVARKRLRDQPPATPPSAAALGARWRARRLWTAHLPSTGPTPGCSAPRGPSVEGRRRGRDRDAARPDPSGAPAPSATSQRPAAGQRPASAPADRLPGTRSRNPVPTAFSSRPDPPRRTGAQPCPIGWSPEPGPRCRARGLARQR